MFLSSRDICKSQIIFRLRRIFYFNQEDKYKAVKYVDGYLKFNKNLDQTVFSTKCLIHFLLSTKNSRKNINQENRKFKELTNKKQNIEPT